MNPAWTADVVRTMHRHRIKQYEVAQRVGITRQYLNAILNGRRTCPDDVQAAIKQAVQFLIPNND